MSDIVFVDFRAVHGQGTQTELFCKLSSQPEWPERGRAYDQPGELFLTIEAILSLRKEDVDVLRLPGGTLSNQSVTLQKLKVFGFPNFKLLDMFPSGQANLGWDVEI